MSQKKLRRLKRLEKETTEVGEVKKSWGSVGIRKILKNNWKFLLILSLGIIAVYFNSLHGDFVSDDYATIPQNPEIMSFKAGLSGWMTGLINWFLAVTFDISSPVAYHVTNLIIYLLSVITAFVFLKILFEDNLIPYFSVLIFAFLPVHVEAVSWISGKPYLLNAFTVLLAMTFFVLYSRTEKKKYLIYFIFGTVLAFAAEMVRSTALIILLILYWISFDNQLKKRIKTKDVLISFAVLLVFALAILVPKILGRIDSVNSGINASDSIFYNPFFQYPTAMAKYLQLILVPTDLTLYHTMYVVPVWLNWVILLTYLTALVWYFFNDKKIFFALAFIFGAAAPSMAPVKVSWLVAERYMFLGSLGMALLLGIIAEKLWQKKILATIILSVLVTIYSIRIIQRNIDWQTNHNLWVNTCQVSPNSHNAWNNIGDDYDKLAQKETTNEGKYKQYLNAVKGFGQSYVIKPNYADAYHNQANIFYKIGRLDLARNGYETALAYNPGLQQTLKTLIQLDLIQKDKTNLPRHLNLLQQQDPTNLENVYIAAYAYAQAGMTDEAKVLANQLYKYYPNVVEIKNLYDQLNSQLNASESAAKK